MKKTINLTESQRALYISQSNAISVAADNKKNQEEKLAFFITGLGIEIGEKLNIELTEEGLIVDDGTGAA